MIIKTVGDLRKLIIENDCKIIIGKLRFEMATTGSDIDIYSHDKLLHWIGHSVDENKVLAELTDGMSTSLDNYADIGKGNKDYFDNQIQPENAPLRERPNKEEYFKGMTDAYEKILIGRKVQVDA